MVQKHEEENIDFVVTMSQHFNQQELKELNLPKESSRLIGEDLLHPGTNITFYHKRDKDLLPFISPS